MSYKRQFIVIKQFEISLTSSDDTYVSKSFNIDDITKTMGKNAELLSKDFRVDVNNKFVNLILLYQETI